MGVNSRMLVLRFSGKEGLYFRQTAWVLQISIVCELELEQSSISESYRLRSGRRVYLFYCSSSRSLPEV